MWIFWEMVGFFFKKNYLYLLCVFVCVCVSMCCVCRCLWKQEEGIGCPGAGITKSSEPPDMGSKN